MNQEELDTHLCITHTRSVMCVCTERDKNRTDCPVLSRPSSKIQILRAELESCSGQDSCYIAVC